MRAAAFAQSAVPAPQRVIHLWVDPHYGDDTQAGTWNPGGANLCLPTDLTPVDVADPSQNGAVLLHASHPFRTITAAIASLPAGGLPYTSPTTNVTWAYAIIHVMPGMISTRTQTSGPLYPGNGFPYNNEIFPIVLPHYVSVQGTSALNTMVFPFDHEEKGTAGPAFRFGVNTTRGPADGEGSFISNLSIFGSGRQDTSTTAEHGAAIHIAPSLASHPTIMNCFIFGNELGVMVENSTDGIVKHDGTALINNTFAWNSIGLWNGQNVSSGIGIGLAELVVVNNIFDATPRVTTGSCGANRSLPHGFGTFGLATGAPTQSGFEGVEGVDMTLSAPVSGNFNAWEYHKTDTTVDSKADFRVQIVPGLPAVNPRNNVGPGVPGAGRDIAPWTGWRGLTTAPLRRGALYVRDVICNAAAQNLGFQASNTKFDGSPGDFRLSPAVADAASTPVAPGIPNASGPGGHLNPLIDNGFGGSYPITLASGRTMINPPGFLSLGTSQATWNFDCRQSDCEGMGNQRDHDHVLYTNGPGGSTDIGADEFAGGSLIAGMRFGTTQFMAVSPGNNLPAGFPAMDNKYVWHLNVPNTFGGITRLVSALPFPKRPSYSDLINVVPQNAIAWPHASLDKVNYSWNTTRTWHWAWTFAGTTGSYRPTMVDISPYLPPDWHPWWSLLSGSISSVASFPEWRHCLQPTAWYNSFLYADPHIGIINPPGSFKTQSALPVQWLDIANPLSPVLKAFPAKGGPLFLAYYDGWCRGSFALGGKFDTMPVSSTTTTPLVALRYSLELWDVNTLSSRGTWTSSASASNLQSFVVIVEK